MVWNPCSIVTRACGLAEEVTNHLSWDRSYGTLGTRIGDFQVETWTLLFPLKDYRWVPDGFLGEICEATYIIG